MAASGEVIQAFASLFSSAGQGFDGVGRLVPWR